MSDSHERFEPLDPGRIDIQSEEEIHYWSRELHCPKARLLQAVERVGNHVTAVRDYLHRHASPASTTHAGDGSDKRHGGS